MKIRKATKKDLNNLSEIFRIESSKRPYNKKWTRNSSLEKIKELFSSEDIFVLIIGDKIVGFITCEKEKTKKLIYIDEMWFNKDYQNKGLGSNLIKYIERIYKKKGFKSISLVSDKRSNAFQFYKKRGYKDHETLIFLQKKL